MPNNQARKNREMGEAKAFCGRRLIEQCNNQPSVGVIGGRFPIEEVRPGWSAWLGIIPSFGLMMRQKNGNNYSIVALDGRRSIILYTTTNQTHAERVNEGMERRWDRGGARGQHNTIIWGVIVIRIIEITNIMCC